MAFKWQAGVNTLCNIYQVPARAEGFPSAHGSSPQNAHNHPKRSSSARTSSRKWFDIACACLCQISFLKPNSQVYFFVSVTQKNKWKDGKKKKPWLAAACLHFTDAGKVKVSIVDANGGVCCLGRLALCLRRSNWTASVFIPAKT